MLRASKGASEVNMQREKNKREGGTANNWPFCFMDTPVWSNLCCDKILSVII